MERILILEDDAALGAGIRMALQTPETEAVLCHTLKDARRTLMQEAFSLLILDINLPDGSGLELLREQASWQGWESLSGAVCRWRAPTGGWKRCWKRR